MNPTLTFLLGLAVWWVAGMTGFAYWYTTDYPMDAQAAVLMPIVGVALGPFAWLFGYVIHGGG